ncbi:MAG: transglutaminase family protein [Steroidobacteraceae bacterium]|jgi:transglutaminase-like putative cysteine protease
MSDTRQYRVRHETVYAYGGDVAHSHQLLHLTPRKAPNQICHSHSITLQPTPSVRHDDIDAFGNPVTRLEYDRPHDRLEVMAHLHVEVQSPEPCAAEDSHAWEAVRRSLCYPDNPATPERLEASRFRMESGYVRIKQTFTEYAADCFTPDRPVLAAALALMHQIHRDFTYAPGTTDIKTSGLEAFQARRGVCQDFAHIMIGCLRSRGLAARYVSGYLRTTPLGAQGAQGAPLVGADASHAWVSVYCPPFGWIDLDPTNDCSVGADHVTIAWGRDFGDVSPLRGVIVGGGRHRLSVRVSVQPE